MSENGEIYTAGINFTLPPAVTAVTAVTNLTSDTDVIRPAWLMIRCDHSSAYVCDHDVVTSKKS